MFNGEIWPDRALDASLAVPVGMYDDPENQSQAPLMVDLVKRGSSLYLVRYQKRHRRHGISLQMSPGADWNSL